MDPDAFNNFIKQIHENWIKPEVDRRGFTEPVFALLIIFKKDGAEVRLNLETSLKVTIDPSVGGGFTPGAVVYAPELARHSIKDIRVPDDVFENHPFIAAVVINNNWTTYFNFIPNKGQSRDHVGLAKDFLLAARNAGTEQTKSYHAFQALEQALHAALLQNPLTEQKVKKIKKHRGVQVLTNEQSKSGNLPKNIAALFNALQRDRPKIYSREKPSAPVKDADLAAIETFIQSVERTLTQ